MNLKKNLEKVFLYVLTMVPMASVALAAESKLTDLINEEARNRVHGFDLNAPPRPASLYTLKAVFQSTREVIIPSFMTSITKEAARERYGKQNPGLSGAEVDAEFEKTLQMLQELGMISTNEREVVSKGPSGI
jgi:hypothetical protein